MEKFILTKKDKFKIYAILYVRLCFFCAISLGIAIAISNVPQISAYFFETAEDGKETIKTHVFLFGLLFPIFLAAFYKAIARQGSINAIKNTIGLFPIAIGIMLLITFKSIEMPLGLLLFVTSFSLITLALVVSIVATFNPYTKVKMLDNALLLLIVISLISLFIPILEQMITYLWFASLFIFGAYAFIDAQIFRCELENEMSQEDFERGFYKTLFNMLINLWGLFFIAEILNKTLIKFFAKNKND